MITCNQKCGFVSIIGNVNAGKSSLMNTLVGYKSSIVTHKKCTTITCTKGIMTDKDTQVIFIDTPGYDILSDTKSDYMKHVLHDIEKSDLLMIVMDSAVGINEGLSSLLKNVKCLTKPKIVVMNKIDLINKPKLLPIIDYVSQYLNCQDIFLTSVTKNIGLQDLRQSLMFFARLGKHHYQPEQKVDMTNERWAAEITRESLLLFLHDEIPYRVSVSPEHWLESDEKVIISQIITVPKISHRQVLLGAGGNKIKLIGTRTRQQIQYYFNKNVSVYLHVKVKNKNF